MRAALFVSVTLNLLLATSIVVARVDLSRRVSDSDTAVERVLEMSVASTMPDGAITAETGLPTSADRGDWLDRYYRSLRSRGLAHEETFLPIAGSVLSTLFAESRREGPYWQPRARSGQESDTSLGQLEDRMRSNLIRLYGEDAVEQPEFAMLFRPLGSSFAFLSSDQQIGVLHWQRALLRQGSHSGPGAPASSGQGCEDGQASRNFGSSADARLSVESRTPPGLEPILLFEFALRTSPLAARLRPLRLDEAAFRTAFQLLETITGARTLGEHLDSRLALRRHLGADRFATLWSGLDPSYRAIADTLQRSGVAAHLIESVYAVVLDSEESFLSIIGQPDAMSPAQITEAHRAEHDRIASLVGSELATALQALRAEPDRTDRGVERAVCLKS